MLRRHQLGNRKQRVAALAPITAAETGLITGAAVDGPYGLCQAAARPGLNVAMDSFYVGKLKGIGAIWQLTAIDVCARRAVCQLIVGDKTAAQTAAFLEHVQAEFAKLDVTVTVVLTDNGPEFTGAAFRDQLALLGLEHHRIPPRSPNHNAVCERFQGTLLTEFYRPFFHHHRINRIAELDAGLQRALIDYNHHRPNHGDYMDSRTPRQMLNEKRAAKIDPTTAAEDRPSVTSARDQEALGELFAYP